MTNLSFGLTITPWHCLNDIS